MSNPAAARAGRTMSRPCLCRTTPSVVTQRHLQFVAILQSRRWPLLQTRHFFFRQFSPVLSPQEGWFTLFRTAVPFWGQNSQITSSLFPKRELRP